MSDICYTVLIINVLQISSVNGKILSCKNFCVQKTNRIFCQTKHENLAFFVILFKQTKEYRNKEKQCRRAVQVNFENCFNRSLTWRNSCGIYQHGNPA